MTKSSEFASWGDFYSRFPATEWTKIEDSSLHEVLLKRLFTRYWRPLYLYLRRKGQNHNDAEDLIQGFFLKVILGRCLLQKADRAKGKFRTLLLTALDRYVISEYRNQKRRQKREKKACEKDNLPPSIPLDPSQAFLYALTADLLERTLCDLKTECYQDGISLHWKVFNVKVLCPILENRNSPSLADICKAFGVPDVRKASNMIVTVKRRFRRILMRQFQNPVSSESQPEEEIAEIIHILSSFSAGKS